MKYKNWLEEWLEQAVKPSSKTRTYQSYNHIVHRHINPHLGEYELEQLTPMVIQAFLSKLLVSGNLVTGKGLSANSVNAVITVLHMSLQTAGEWGLCSEFPLHRIKRPRKQEKEIGCFTLAEQKRIEQYVQDDKREKLFGVILCMYTGLRVGELLALTWDHVDFSEGTILVAHSCHDSWDEEGNYVRVLESPKTSSSRRQIPIPQPLLPILQERERYSHSPYVVSDEKGSVLSVRSYQRSFELMLRRLNIDHRGFHALRHTFATRALECGMDVKTLAEILGHKNPTVTLERYVHSMMEHKREMMNRLGKIL